MSVGRRQKCLGQNISDSSIQITISFVGVVCGSPPSRAGKCSVCVEAHMMEALGGQPHGMLQVSHYKCSMCKIMPCAHFTTGALSAWHVTESK